MQIRPISNNVKITGTKEIQRAMKRLPDELKRGGESAVLRAGARPIAKSAKAKAPVGKGAHAGLLKKSIGSNVKKVRGVTSARVGARKGWKITDENGKTKDPSKYSHLVELGTSHSAAKPFIRPAVESTKDQVITEMAYGLDKYLTRAANRVRSRR